MRLQMKILWSDCWDWWHCSQCGFDGTWVTLCPSCEAFYSTLSDLTILRTITNHTLMEEVLRAVKPPRIGATPAQIEAWYKYTWKLYKFYYAKLSNETAEAMTKDGTPLGVSESPRVSFTTQKERIADALKGHGHPFGTSGQPRLDRSLRVPKTIIAPATPYSKAVKISKDTQRFLSGRPMFCPCGAKIPKGGRKYCSAQHREMYKKRHQRALLASNVPVG